jgi:hypothetical protein
MNEHDATPDTIEFVRYAQVRIDDVLVHVNVLNVDADVRPTQRRLNAKRCSYVRVTSIEKDVTPYNVSVLEINRSHRSRITALSTAGVWRIIA